VKTEDMLKFFSMLQNKTGELKAIMDDIQQFSEHLAEASKIGKRILQKVEEIKK
jgi:hypothetical protein